MKKKGSKRNCWGVTFSPPDKFAIFFQLFLGGLTLKTTPSEKGSKESTNSSSASPPRVIICRKIMISIATNLIKIADAHSGD